MARAQRSRPSRTWLAAMAALCAAACTLPETIVLRPRDADVDARAADAPLDAPLDAPDTLDAPPGLDAPLDAPPPLDAPQDVPIIRDAPPDAPVVTDACATTADARPMCGPCGTVDGGMPCGSSIGACRTGLLQCVGSTPTCIGAVGPTPEVCNGVDDDCNGAVDNGACPMPSAGYCAPAAMRCCNTASATAGGCSTTPCPAGFTCLDRPGVTHLCCL